MAAFNVVVYELTREYVGVSCFTSIALLVVYFNVL